MKWRFLLMLPNDFLCLEARKTKSFSAIQSDLSETADLCPLIALTDSSAFSFNWKADQTVARFLSDSAFWFSKAQLACGTLACTKRASCWYLLSRAGLFGLSTYHSCQPEGLQGLRVVWLQWRLWKDQFVTQINEPVWYFVCKVWLGPAVTTETQAVVWHY